MKRIHCSQKILLSEKMSPKEVASYFRRNNLKGQKGWRIKYSDCQYLSDHENYNSPLSYYLITAIFEKSD